MNITNTHGVSLPLAVWLLHDDYDYNNEKNYISATSLLKPTKQTILGSRVLAEDREADVGDFLSQRMGSAIHDSIERAWRMSAAKAMVKLGYPENVAANIQVNPTPEELADNPDIIPVWIELRTIKEIVVGNVVWKIGGKFDMVIQGRLFDTKTTSVYAFMKGGKDDDYKKQGSIYKWLNPDKIDSDHIFIQFLFTDWQRARAKQDPNYPQIKTAEHPVLLMDAQDTEDFIVAKIRELSLLWDAPEDKLPQCTDVELWRSDPEYKYYSDPNKITGRSTKNFDNLHDANLFKNEKGKGVVITKLGEPKACEYCAAFAICKQGNSYFAQGS